MTILGFTPFELVRVVIALLILFFFFRYGWPGFMNSLTTADEQEDQERRKHGEQIAREAVWDYENHPRNADHAWEDEPGPFAQELIDRGKL